jgi:alkylation response protein AidB-like acyl-CoA dehydrogenase
VVPTDARPTDDLDAFRHEVRTWCAANVPAGWRERERGASPARFAEFHRWWGARLREGGWFAPHWPREWGGGGLSLPEQVVLAEELARADAPRNALYQVALYNAGPSILHAGTDEQKARFLPPTVAGMVWCQGFSEPDAGSDLAALATRAVRDGDDYVVTGRKVWTSFAHEADRCILLVRTNAGAPKRRGITFLLMDMREPGVTVRPIRQATGQSEFCELVLDEVRVPVTDRLGAEDEGWAVTGATMASERGVVLVELAERLSRNGVGALVEALREWPGNDGRPLRDDARARGLVARHHAGSVVLRQLLGTMVATIVERGGVGDEAAVVKILYSELLERLMGDGARLQGMPALLARPPLASAGWETGDWLFDRLNAYGWTIGGGTNEVMRNIVAERVLGLPREPGLG